MTKNPLINALLAAGYISLLVTLIFNSPRVISDNELGMMLPVIMLSTLVFSVALMGYLFFYQPVLLLIDKQVKEGTQLFLRTVAAFVLITLTIVLTYAILYHVL